MSNIKNNRITILMYIIVSAYILLGLILGISLLNKWIYINNYPVNSIADFVNKQLLDIIDNLIILFASILYAIIWLIFKKLHKYLIMNFLMMISLISVFLFFHNFLYPFIKERIIDFHELNIYSISLLLLYLFLIVLAIMPLFITITYISGKTKTIGYNKINVFDLIVILISLLLVTIPLIDYVIGILNYQKYSSPVTNIEIFTHIIGVVVSHLPYILLTMYLILKKKRIFWIPYLYVGTVCITSDFLKRCLIDASNNVIYDINKIVKDISSNPDILSDYDFVLKFYPSYKWLILIFFVLILIIKLKKIKCVENI